LKEGRRNGDTDLLGRDGFWRVRAEARFLKANAGKIEGLPRVLTTFCADDCFYLVMEEVKGENLHQMVVSRKKISRRRLLGYCAEMARTVAQIHLAGWAWLDCKPGNFLSEPGRRLRPLDFDAACALHKSDPWPRGTPGYIAPESRKRLAAP